MTKALNWQGRRGIDYPDTALISQDTVWAEPETLCPQRTTRIRYMEEGWKLQPNLHIRVLISVGMPYHTGEYFASLTDFLNRIAKERSEAGLPKDSFAVSYVVGDSLQRWNIDRDANPPLARGEARKESLRRGAQWIENEFEPTVVNNAVFKWNAILWDNLKGFFGPEEFRTRRALVGELLKENAVFAKAVDDDVRMFVERHFTGKDNAERTRFEQHSRSYILEEVAVFSFYPQEPGCVDLYPRGNLQSFQVLQDGKVQGSARTQCIIDGFLGRKMGLIDDKAKALSPDAVAMAKRRVYASALKAFYDGKDTPNPDRIHRNLATALPAALTSLRTAATNGNGDEVKKLLICAERAEQNLPSLSHLGTLLHALCRDRFPGNGILTDEARQAGMQASGIINALTANLIPLASYLQSASHPQASKVSDAVEKLQSFGLGLEAAIPESALQDIATAYQQRRGRDPRS